MLHRLTISLRTCAVLAFLGVLPAIAVPPVNNWMYEQWQELRLAATGSTPTNDPMAVETAPAVSIDLPLHAEESEVVAASPLKQPAPSRRIDESARIHRELQSLGAEGISIKASPSLADGYQASCEIELADNPAYRRPFTAEAHDPKSAMQHMLTQVRAWRLNRQPTAVSDRRARPGDG